MTPQSPPGAGFARPGPAPGLVYASFGLRFVALVIDFVIVGIISGVFAVVIGAGFVGLYGTDWFRGSFMHFDWTTFDWGRTWLIYALLQAVVSGLYFVGSWRTWNATPGQRIFDLQVRNAADGAPLGQEQGLKRWALITVPIITSIPGLGLLVFLYQLFLAYTTWVDPARQGFHDKQCHTVVVQRA